MTTRKKIRWALTILTAPFLVILYFNIENLAVRLGWGDLLADAVAPLSGDSPFIEFFKDPLWLWPSLVGIGIALGLWFDLLLSTRERKTLVDQSPAKKTERLNAWLTDAYKTIGMAIGTENSLQYELAIAGIEPFFLDLSNRNDFLIPELRKNGAEAGLYRALIYLNNISPPLQLDDDLEVKKRAANVVPDLNTKDAKQLREQLNNNQM